MAWSKEYGLALTSASKFASAESKLRRGAVQCIHVDIANIVVFNAACWHLHVIATAFGFIKLSKGTTNTRPPYVKHSVASRETMPSSLAYPRLLGTFGLHTSLQETSSHLTIKLSRYSTWCNPRCGPVCMVFNSFL